jgi:hypothetical protein
VLSTIDPAEATSALASAQDIASVDGRCAGAVLASSDKAKKTNVMRMVSIRFRGRSASQRRRLSL